MNMLSTIEPKSDQLNADDLIGRTMTITITGVEVPGGEQPVSVFFDGDNGKPYKPGKSMRRVMVSVWGPDANAYVGQAMTLYRDEKVQFGGMAVGGIRISHMTGLKGDKTMALTATRGNKKAFVVKPLAAQRVAQADAPQPTFLEATQAALNACQAGDDVFVVMNKARVKKALNEAPQDVKDRLNAMIRAAHERFMPPREPQDDDGAGEDAGDARQDEREVEGV